MVACIVEHNHLYCASVGDSRIYIIRGSGIHQLTRDHNYYLRLLEMQKAGLITMKEAMETQRKEALLSYLGIGNISLMDIQMAKIQSGDIIMLCSDGITNTFSDTQIRYIITAMINPEEKAEALITAASHFNTHSLDNTSVILLCYQEKVISNIL